MPGTRPRPATSPTSGGPILGLPETSWTRPTGTSPTSTPKPNTVNILNSLDARQLKLHSNEVAQLIRRAPTDNPQIQHNVRQLNLKLQTRE